MRWVRLWTNQKGESEFEEGTISLQASEDNLASEKMEAVTTHFEEIPSRGQTVWHTAPTRQLAVTLGGM